MNDPFELFAQEWLSRLRQGARIAFENAPLSERKGTHCDVADGFVEGLGLKPIGFNWELLDASGEIGMTRSALGELTQALSCDISNPSKPWLTYEAAEECSRQFLGLFDAAHMTVVANRYDGLWNPISGAINEWGFVAFDRSNAALLLIADA